MSKTVMPIIDIQTRKMRKLVQNVVDASFVYLKMFNSGTPFQKKTSHKKYSQALESMHEFLEGGGKLVKIKPNKDVLTYSTGAKHVTIFNKLD